jgi:peptide/nickel transport system substrate-binding protein
VVEVVPEVALSSTVTLVFARGGDIQSMDPAFLFDGESSRTSVLIHEPLIRTKPGSDGELQPALAEKWSISDDGLTYTFNLRKGVKFHDGAPFNAEAVKFNYERQLPQNAEPRMQLAKPLFGAVNRIEATDEFTVKIILKERRGPFPIQLSQFSAFIASAMALKTYGKDYTAHPTGTGPFVFENWERDSQYVVKANPEYWGGRPKLDRVVLRVTKEASVRVDQLLVGEADIIPDIAPTDVNRIESNPNTAILSAPAINFAVLGFLMFKKPFTDVRVRRAINHAVNRETLVKFLYKDKGIALQTTLPKASWAFNPQIKGYPYDPDTAKKLLADAGYASGLSFEALTFTQARPYCPLGMTKVAEIIQADLKRVGVEMKLRPMPGVAETEDAAARGEGDAYFTGYFFIGDPGPIFDTIWTSKASAPNGGNLPRYMNPEVDKLIAQALTELDQKKRKQLYWKVQELIVADAPMVFINSYSIMRGIRKNVTGFVIQPDQNDYLWMVDKT